VSTGKGEKNIGVTVKYAGCLSLNIKILIRFLVDNRS